MTAQETDPPLKIRPELSAKFRPGAVNHIIENTIREHLVDKKYSSEEAPTWAKSISDEILSKTKEQNFARYKLIVNVILGECQGEGVSSAYRCLWDAESDCAATYKFINDTMFCVCVVCGVYLY